MLQYSINSWNPLTLTYNEKLAEAIKEMHHAALFVGMLGEAFLPKANDDSQSNLEWLPKQQAMAGHQVQKSRAQMTYDDWNLQLLGANDLLLGSIDPTGKTKDELLQWFREQLQKTPFPPQQYDYFSHFSLPDHSLDHGQAFAPISQEIRRELALYRQNAHWVLNQTIQPFSKASTVRTWPHHFDTGSVIALEFSEGPDTPTSTIGIGWAIADEAIDVPYFYINHWKKGATIHYDNLPDLPDGCRWHQGNWTGPILPLSSLTPLEGDQQLTLVKAFFEKGIAASKGLLEQ